MDDQILYCRDCGREFLFTVGEQEFYASKGLSNPPGRCPDCRIARKISGNGDKPRRENPSQETGGKRILYHAVCGQCGKSIQVPFQPWPERPVYCNNCFQEQRGAQAQRAH